MSYVEGLHLIKLIATQVPYALYKPLALDRLLAAVRQAFAQA